MANILLAEDDETMRNILTIALENAGHDITPAIDGMEALNALNTGEKFDLLLTDIVMPGIDGTELAKNATQKNPDIKVMFITGFAAIAAKQKQAKDTQTLSKPFHLNDLIEQVENLLNK